MLPFSLNTLHCCQWFCLADWRHLRPGQMNVVTTVRLSARTNTGEVESFYKLEGLLKFFPRVARIELALGGKRLPEQLCKKLRRTYPDLAIDILTEARTHKRKAYRR